MTRRVGICGIAVESNALAPTTRLSDFEGFFYGAGDALAAMLDGNPRYDAFRAALDATGIDWTPVPLLLATAESGGPVAPDDFEALLARLLDEVDRAGPLDALWIVGHGAGTLRPRSDMDGPYLAALRQALGPDCAMVALFDYHANISDEMMRAVNASVGYRTNPHTDINARSGECGAVLGRMLGGGQPHTAWIRLPLLTPQIVQRTDVAPMHGIMAEVERALADRDVATASVYPGFALGDTPDNGFSVVVSSWTGADHAAAHLSRIAARAWSERDAFRADLKDIATAIALTRSGSGPWLLADIADNPGGGGRGNTPHLMKALLAAGIEGVQIVPVFDPALAAEAHTLGEGAVFSARFNRDETAPHSDPFTHDARVVRLTDGVFHHASGLAAGLTGQYGPSALLELGGVRVAVTSRRRQTLGPSEFRHFGLRPEDAHIIVAKSRGHFRAGFRGVVPDARIVEVDAPGLVTANLASVDWQGLVRPIHPLDPIPDGWPDTAVIKNRPEEKKNASP